VNIGLGNEVQNQRIGVQPQVSIQSVLRVPGHTLMYQYLVLCVTFYVCICKYSLVLIFLKLSLVLVSKPVC
jgi:hypothetical protein